MSIYIDKEFESLIPPLSDKEFKQLEENCVRDGIRDPLIIWETPSGKEILIDGHNRWKIAANHCGIPFETVKMKFDDRDAAKAWIIKNQFGRRNLSAYDRSVLALKLKPLLVEKAKEKEHERKTTCQKSDKSYDTKKELAKAAGVSHDTINRVARIEEMASDRTKQLIREGKMSINQAYNATFPPRQDPVKKAKQEHELYLQNRDKVVDLKEKRIDRANQEIINNALTMEVLKLLNIIGKFGLEHKTSELKALQSEISDEDKDNVLGLIKNSKMILDEIVNAIRR
jgi:hypothetical protein